MNISTPPCRFTGQVNLYPIRSAYHTDQVPFGQHFAAANAGPLRNVFSSSFRCFDHVLLYR